jgi:hypothetical protein
MDAHHDVCVYVFLGDSHGMTTPDRHHLKDAPHHAHVWVDVHSEYSAKKKKYTLISPSRKNNTFESKVQIASIMPNIREKGVNVDATKLRVTW